MLTCPKCGCPDLDREDDTEYFCLECEHTFTFVGDHDDTPPGPTEAEIADAVDMQTFEDRMNPCGDD